MYYTNQQQPVRAGKENKITEMKRRFKMAKIAFGKLSFVLKNSTQLDFCIFLVLSYGA